MCDDICSKLFCNVSQFNQQTFYSVSVNSNFISTQKNTRELSECLVDLL